MDRRDILRRCGAVSAAGLGLLTGCSGGGDDPTDESADETSASLEVTDFDYHEGDSGTLVVTATVENAGKSEATGHLYVTVTAAATTADPENGTATESEETVASRESREVTVPGGEATNVEIPFELGIEQFERSGTLELDLRT
jgi:hypothetical protein